MTEARSVFDRAFELGPAAQSIVAGAYAWAVTVAPVGFGRHGSSSQNWPATVTAMLALGALVRGAIAEARKKSAARADAPDRIAESRTLTLFSFSAMSLITWILDDGALSPVHLGASRGVAGMIGWALFAYACSAPVVEPVTFGGPPARIEAGGRARGRVRKGDSLIVFGGVVLAGALQLIGWSVTSPERAILVRVTTLGVAVLFLGGVGAFVSSRHGVEEPRNPRARVRSKGQRPLPLGWVVAVVLLLAAGILYVLTD